MSGIIMSQDGGCWQAQSASASILTVSADLEDDRATHHDTSSVSHMSEHIFTQDLRIQLYDTDAAGRLFFAHLFRHAHDAFEAFMDHLGFPLDRLISGGEVLLPLVHAEADYLRPLCHGDQARVSLTIEDIRNRSFAVSYRFETDPGQLVATARTIHVQIRPDGSPGPGLPEALRAALTGYLSAAPPKAP